MKNRKLSLPKVLTRIPEPEKALARFQIALLPGIRDLISEKEYNKLDGSLRRGDLSVVNSAYLKKVLADCRSGDRDVDANAYYRLYQFCSLLKKYPFQGSDDLCRQAALEKFQEGESQCASTNSRISDNLSWLGHYSGEIRKVIYQILGDMPSNYLSNMVEFGPGSTVNPADRSYDESCSFYKLSDKLYVPRRQLNDLKVHLFHQHSWMEALRIHYHINDYVDRRRPTIEVYQEIFDRHLVVVDDDFPNRISFVPKSSDEHRAIGIELSGSILLQKQVGNLIRRALKRFGLDLNSQSRNVHFARLAKTFNFATVDLANASNTLSRETVKALLPPDWFAVMDCYRSHYGSTKSGDFSCRYNMFSSMGNGFTFELESLIFFAIAYVIVKEDLQSDHRATLRNVAVFGDDIIIPNHLFGEFVETINFYGFSTNIDKSFVTGNFFESCGSDFYDCTDVRPFFLKRELSTVKDIYFFCNSILFKCIKVKNPFLFPVYLAALKELARINIFPDMGPLHFYEGRDGWAESSDDLEAVLRVPLEFAQKHGGVSFDTTLFAWTYRKWVRVSIEIPLSKNSQYNVQNIKYLTWLMGTRDGRAVYKNRSKFKLVKRSTSSWDGTLSRRDLALVSRLFETKP